MDVGLLVLTTLSLGTAIGLGALLWRMSRRDQERTRARIAALSAAMAASAPAGAGGPTLWRGTDTTPRLAVGSAHRLIRLGVAAMMVLALLVAGTIEASRTTAPAADGWQPLELVSMRHAADGATLMVSGIVRTPVSGGREGTVTALVTGFDRDGATVAIATAPVALAPGDESSFTVAVPGGATIARYRVSFRAGQTIVRHVDRRNIVASSNVR